MDKKAIRKMVEEWFTKQCRDVSKKFYLFYIPHQEKYCISEEFPGNEWVLASLRQFSIGWTIDRAYTYCLGVLWVLPILKDTE